MTTAAGKVGDGVDNCTATSGNGHLASDAPPRFSGDAKAKLTKLEKQYTYALLPTV